jgi:hypothetical protein
METRTRVRLASAAGGPADEVEVRGLDGGDILMLQEASAVPSAALARRLAEAVAPATGTAERPWRDVERILLATLAATFGPEPELIADCSACGGRFAVAPDIAAMLATDPDGTEEEVALPPPFEDWRLRFRGPSAAEMERAGRSPAGAPAERRLRDSMVVALTAPQGAVPLTGAGPEVAAAVDRALADANAAGLLIVGAACPLCGEAVACRIDPLALIRAEAARNGDVLLEVARLAVALGWPAPELLALPHVRRRRLLAIVGAEA